MFLRFLDAAPVSGGAKDAVDAEWIRTVCRVTSSDQSTSLFSKGLAVYRYWHYEFLAPFIAEVENPWMCAMKMCKTLNDGRFSW